MTELIGQSVDTLDVRPRAMPAFSARFGVIGTKRRRVPLSDKFCSPSTRKDTGMIWTQQDIECWLNDLRKSCAGAEWQPAYKQGFSDALTQVMIKMDNDLKRYPSELKLW